MAPHPPDSETWVRVRSISCSFAPARRITADTADDNAATERGTAMPFWDRLDETAGYRAAIWVPLVSAGSKDGGAIRLSAEPLLPPARNKSTAEVH
jgi:hypothetical protein